jgi:glycosyltransferase involved in cell wall biosynthesis
MKKRLLITSDSFLPRWDGIARVLSEIIPRLSKKYDVSAVVPRFHGKQPRFKEAKITRIPLSGTQFGDYPPAKYDYKRVESAVKESDIVFNQTIGPIGFAAIRAAKKHNIPVVSYIHSIEWELFSKAMKRLVNLVRFSSRVYARYVYNKCRLLLLPSKDVEKVLTENKIRTKTKVVMLGTDVAKFIPPLDKKKAKKSIGISPKYNVIGFCGRIGREKDLTTLYRAFTKLKHSQRNIKLLIVGSGLKETEEALLEQKDIMLVGSKDNVVPYLQAMDVYVLPSLTETTSISTLEAMACGLAVAVTPVGYVRRYVQEGKNGMFFPKKSSSILAKKIGMLLKSEKLRQRLGEEARKTIVRKFSWEKTASGIEEALEEVSKS